MTREKKAPAMPLYGKDAWSDEAFNVAEWDAQGLFWRLAFWQWMEGSIPADLKTIINVVGKPHSTKRLWPDVQKFFVAHPTEAGRLFNLTTEMHRAKLMADRDRKRKGADVTNAKRDAKRPEKEHAKRTEKGALRVLATANANAVVSGSPEGEPEREPSPLPLSPPDFEAVARLMPRFGQVGLRIEPTEQIVVGWVQTYGEEMILEVLAHREKALHDGHYSYIETVLHGWRENPHERPSNRRSGTNRRTAPHDSGNGKKPTARDFGMRTAADVLSGKRDV